MESQDGVASSCTESPHLRWNTGTWCWMIHLGGWYLKSPELLDLVCWALAFINPCCLKCESGSSRFQPGEGPSRGLLRDCTTSQMDRFAALNVTSAWCQHSRAYQFSQLGLRPAQGSQSRAEEERWSGVCFGEL